MKTQVSFQRSVRIIFAGMLILLFAGCTDLGMAQSTENSHNKNNIVAAPITRKPAIIEKSQIPPDKPSEDKLIGLVSEYLSSSSPIEYLQKIKTCLDQLEGFSGITGKNPFFWFAKGLVSQHEGDLETASGFMNKAASIAPNNRDIGLWIEAFENRNRKDPDRSIKLGTADSGLDGDSFNFYYGTMWVNEYSLLVTVEKGSGPEAGQYLMYMDADTLQVRQVYKGSNIVLDFVTPDGRYVVLNDKGLRLVALDSGEAVLIDKDGLCAALSPDGKYIAYCAGGLWLYEIETGENTRLNDGRDDASPIWFPDGKSLLFIGDLGGEELGGGAGHLQGIFRMPAQPVGKKERIDVSWEGKFHYIGWILAGEIFHAEEGWDDGFNSVAYYLGTGLKNELGSINDGNCLAYRQDNADHLYISNGRGRISLMDLEGRVQSKFEYGNIWGSAFGFPVRSIQVLEGNAGLLMYYRTPLENVMHIYKMDEIFGNPYIIADIPQESPQKAIVDRTSSRALFAVSARELI